MSEETERIPERFVHEHLFMLIGKNPLPNYVAAKLLLRQSSWLYLVHTTDTADVARRIRKMLGRADNDRTTLIHVDPSNSSAIYNRVFTVARELDDVGLHFTGGTKGMVLYTYRAIVDAGSGRADPPVLSYLDARTLSLYLECGVDDQHVQPVSTHVELKLETLLELHGSIITEREDIAFCPAIYPARIAVEEEVQAWRKEFLVRSKDKTDILLPPIDRLAEYWPGCKTIEDLAVQWETSVGQVKSWFGGYWLEHYTLASVQAVANKCAIHDCAKNIKTREKEFEFDVVAMRGYQLFAISCTTSKSKTTLKQKLFEAYIRARQMGGDEARVALVCRAPKSGESAPRNIEGEIAKNWDAAGRVRVFGAQHLPDLARHLQNWFDER